MYVYWEIAEITDGYCIEACIFQIAWTSMESDFYGSKLILYVRF